MIREYTTQDYPQLVAIDHAIYPARPSHINDYAERDQIFESKNPELLFKRWVYEQDGQIVAYAQHSRGLWNFHLHKFLVAIRVHPQWQEQGIGTQLYNILGESLSPHQPELYFAQIFEPHETALTFAEKRGFVVTLREGELRLKLADYEPTEFEPILQKMVDQGIEIKSATAWGREIPNIDRVAYDLDMTISPDMPTDEPFQAPSFDVWHATVWQREMHLKDGLMLARHRDKFIGLSIIWANRGSTLINQDLTGVLREYRGQGVGLALKVHVLNYCRANSYTALRTQNELENVPMLKINQRLGFTAQPAWLHLTKNLD